MLYTEHYKLGSFEAGNIIDPLEESKRFLTIDRQLLGLFQVFGNGVVTGWDISIGNGLSVSISPGRAHVYYMSAQTTDIRIVSDLVPNSVNYIYAQALDTTPYDKDVRFFSNTIKFLGGQQILIGSATTNSGSIVSIDSSVRTDISFIESIKTLINQHRHRGPDDNPSKIDLSSEVMGKLPGYRIEELDASLVNNGRLSSSRMPLINHSDLADSGVLTHAQLDSFVRNLSTSNVRLLGELGAINLLQMYIAFKHMWNEVDSYSTNLLVMVPGISKDSFTDWTHTNAVVDKTNHLIQGVPTLAGQLLKTNYRTLQDFNSAASKIDTAIGQDNGGAYVSIVRPFNELIIENFDVSAALANAIQTSYVGGDTWDQTLLTRLQSVPGWIVETVPANSETSFTRDPTQKAQGTLSAKWTVDQQVRVQITKVFNTAVDWSNYNEIELYVKTMSPSHGRIMFQILAEDETDSTQLKEILIFPLLDPSETTTAFRRITSSLEDATPRKKVKALRIFTETGALSWDMSKFVLNIDKISISNNLYYKNSARMRFRFKTPQSSKWAAISWSGETNGGSIQARARTAPIFDLFDQSSSSPFSPYFSVSGGDPKVTNNTCVEFEIVLNASPDKKSTPVLRSISLSYLTSGEETLFKVNTVKQFSMATILKNVRIQEPGEVLIDGRIDAGDIYYGMEHSVQQTEVNGTGEATEFSTPIVGFGGENLPVSPLQATQPNFNLKYSSLNGVASVERLEDRTYLVADTLNDRIIIFDKNGIPQKIFASNNVFNVKEVYPVQASYNSTVKILYIAWSSKIRIASLNLSKITINGVGLSLTLSNTNDSLVRLTGPLSETETSNVSAIKLSDAHALQLMSFLGSAEKEDQKIWVKINPDAVEDGINVDSTNYSTLVGPRGLQIYVGDFKYLPSGSLYKPISISRTSYGTWLICNAKPLLLLSSDKTDPLTGADPSSITSVIELNPDTGEIIFSDDSVDFSLLSLGGATEYSDGYIAVAGIVKEKPIVSGQSEKTEIKASLGSGTEITKTTTTTTTKESDNVSNQTVVQKTSDLDELMTNRTGRIKIIEKKSGRTVFDQNTSDGTYASDIQIDSDGYMVVVEKSISTNISTGRVIKIDEDGNIFFQFGMKEMSSPNDVRVLSSGNLMVST